jgi:hypothetical protein
LCDCTMCHPACMSPLDMPVPQADCCGDVADDGYSEQGGDARVAEDIIGAGVRLPSAGHRVMQPGTLTLAHMSNRLGR